MVRKGNTISPGMLNTFVEVVNLGTEAERRASFRALDSENKKLVWRTRLALHIAVGRLDETKELLIFELLSLMDDRRLYTEAGRAEMKPSFDDFERRARDVFGKSETYRVFMSLGNETGCSKGSGESLGGNCNCYYETYCELQNEWWTCRNGGCAQVAECGIIFTTNCTGKCGV